ncbi:Zn-dependent oligopeptidase [Candidatus Dependentiae bacterium]|nr:Zn-dependent oligopeptidase [Candidatus Dependentiae bacterium]MCG2756713.1 Zn-dependent oligopeptidase [Candidatus Dependentiae bacterium]
MIKFKKSCILGLVLTLSGCSFLNSSKDVINMQDYKEIISGKFKNINDVVNLFPKSVADIKARSEYLKEFSVTGIKDFLNIKPEDRTFDNTARALDILEASFGAGINALQTYEFVCPDDQIRQACHDISIELEKFSIETFFNKDIYNSFKAYVEDISIKENLNAQEKYFLEESMKDYKRSGFDLQPDKFLQVKELKKEISEFRSEFDKNVNADNSFIEVEEFELSGMTPDFINALSKTENGKYILKCDYPTYFEIIKNCTNSNTRKKLYFLFQNRAYPKNIENLNLVINKRDELAKLLGFESFAALDIDSQMAKNPERAEKFLTELADKTIIKMDKEFELFLKDLPEGVVLDANGKMSPWDYSFVVEAYKKKYFDIDERVISEYFPVENTINKIFEIYQKFLSLKFELVAVNDLWHKDVVVAKIYDKDGKNLKGYLFLDLYPRENKYSHACMIDIITTTKYKDHEVPSVIMVIANFPKATKEKPALLKHNDVETFFHEFGHAMHGLLGQTELTTFSGTNVKKDFVELPSQMFEEWMWDKEMLKFVSSHYKTGQSLPDELIDKKLELKKLNLGYFVTRQVVLSLLSLESFKSGQNKNIDKINKDLYEKYMKNVRFEPETHMQASFGHLMGYSAKYYGYMWSKVFALDMFENIKKSGLLNPEMGQKLINLVLGKGGSVDPDILLKDFLGREPNQEAFLKDIGI